MSFTLALDDVSALTVDDTVGIIVTDGWILPRIKDFRQYEKAIFTSVTSLLFTVLLAGSALAQAADQPTGKLVVYTSQAPEIAQQTMDAFKAAYPDIQVEWTRNGTTQLMNVLHTEMMSGRVKPDVLLVADAINLGALKKSSSSMPIRTHPLDT